MEEMGAIKIKSIHVAQRSQILIKKKRKYSDDSSAMVSLQLIRGDKKITQSRKIYDALVPGEAGNKDSLCIHLHKLNDEFLGLKKAYTFDEISMEIEVGNHRTEKIKRRKIVLTKK